MAADTYHVNGKGEVGKCSATRGKCPFGGAEQHYTSQEGAQKAYERGMSEVTVPVANRKFPPAREEQVQAAVASGLLKAEEGPRVGSTVYSTDYLPLGRNQHGRRTFAEVRLTQQPEGTWEHDVRVAVIEKGERRMKVSAPQLESINPAYYQFKESKLSSEQLETLRGLGGWGSKAVDLAAGTDEATMHKLLKLSATLKG